MRLLLTESGDTKNALNWHKIYSIKVNIQYTVSRTETIYVWTFSLHPYVLWPLVRRQAYDCKPTCNLKFFAKIALNFMVHHCQYVCIKTYKCGLPEFQFTQLKFHTNLISQPAGLYICISIWSPEFVDHFSAATLGI